MGALRLTGVILVALGIAGAAVANPNKDNRDRDKDRNDRGGVEETATVRAISVSDDTGQILITAVIVMSNTDVVLGATTDVGVRRVDENRLDLSGMPLIGGLFGGGNDEQEDGPDSPIRVGTAYLIGNSLAVDLGTPLPVTPVSTGSAAEATAAERAAAGAAIEAQIREAANAAPAGRGLPHQLDGESMMFDGLKLLNRKYSYYLPDTEFVVVGGLTEASGETEGGGKIPVIGEIPLLRSLFGRPAGDAYLQRRDLVILIKPSILEDDYE